MRYSRCIFVILLINVFSLDMLSSQDIPERPVPPKMVNDFAKILSDRESGYLENKLVLFNDSTSTQIVIVTINSLEGYDIMDYAQRLGEKWGIGQKQLNNGILILVKPRTADSKGEVTIVQGYGLEAVIPDITCAQIIDNELLPAFREATYYVGFDNATSALMSLARGEFSADEYADKSKKDSGDGSLAGLVIFIIILIIMVIGGRSKGSNNRNIGSGNLPLWLMLSMMNSGGSHKGSWGGFSGGSSGGGGFGGFGGGSFGGGGARGSW